MNFTSCCVNDDIHCCKSTLITDFGTGLGLWALFSLLYTDLVAKTWNVGQGAKAGWAMRAHETKGSFHWWCLGHVLLIAGDCTWLKHPLLAHLGAFHSTMPWVQAAKRHGQRGTCAGEVDTSVPALPMDTLMCIGSSLTAAGDPKRRHRGVSGGREDSALGRHQALHGHLRERGHKGDTWTTIRKTCECSCSDIPYQPDDPAASKAAGGTSHTSGDNISVPSAQCQTQVSLQAPREARQWGDIGDLAN